MNAYRILKDDDVIQEGDEWCSYRFMGCNIWHPEEHGKISSCIGFNVRESKAHWGASIPGITWRRLIRDYKGKVTTTPKI